MAARPDRLAFGGFVLERSQKRLLPQSGPPVELTPRLFSALLLLVDHAGELVDKEQMLQAVWPGLVVSDNSLSQVIAALRRTLGDDAQGSRFIQTVPRKGFRFIAQVNAVDADAPRPPLDAAAPAPLKQGPGPRRRRLVLAAATAAGAGAVAWWWGPTASDGNTTASLAVLPFINLDGGEGHELVGTAMAEGLVARLSRLPDLAVRSPASAMRFSGTQQDARRAAEELDVAWVVDGSVRRGTRGLHVLARLVRTRDGTAAWNESFDMPADGLFELQDRIADRVARALTGGVVASTQNARVDHGGTRSAEAYQLYLTAAWRAQGGRADDIERSIALLQQALRIDPGYAQAWAMLGWTHRRRLWNADAEPAAVFQPSDAAVERALAIAPTLALARAGVGFSRFWYHYDWAGAEREFRAALESNPNEPGAQWGLAFLLLTQGQVDAGFVHMRRARETDPMSPVLHTLEASFLISDGRLHDAQRRIEHALDIAPNLWLAHLARGLLLLARRDGGAGIAALRQAAELAPNTVRPQAVLAQRLAQAGQPAEARAILQRLRLRARQTYVPPTSLAMVHAALGETEAALDALDRAYAVRDTRLISLKDDPSWRPLQAEPRFALLKRQLGLDALQPGLTSV